MTNSRKYKRKYKKKSKKKAGSMDNNLKVFVRNKRQNNELIRRVYPQLNNNNLLLLQDNLPQHPFIPPPRLIPPPNAPPVMRQPGMRNLEANAGGKKQLKKTRKFKKFKK
tara:strand:+ start:126 stop:455 length:330 start_codon:yes stop_codon:yes gene_type:complete